MVNPLLKKPSLSPDDMTNYHPISNLNFISKILERIVAKRIHAHMVSSSLYLPFQSAYRKYHSTETALLAVHDYFIHSLDNGKVAALILLDLSAAFDTVDHTILLHRLEHWFGIFGTALHHWYSTYLDPRTQSVCINGNTSEYGMVIC